MPRSDRFGPVKNRPFRPFRRASEGQGSDSPILCMCARRVILRLVCTTKLLIQKGHPLVSCLQILGEQVRIAASHFKA